MTENKETTTTMEAGKGNENGTTGAAKLVRSLPEGLNRRRPVPATGAAAALAPRPRSTWDDLKEQAVLAYASGLLPRSVDSREKAITIALMGKELGLSPMQSLCGIYVVNGMVALRGATMLRLIYERVPGARITVLTPPELADRECVVEMQRPGGNPHNFRFTVEEARKAGFMSKPIWQQHTGTMLRWSAIRTGARIVFADAIAGCYMEDEIPGTAAVSATAPSPLPSAEPVYEAPEPVELPETPAVAAAPAVPAPTTAPPPRTPTLVVPTSPNTKPDVYYSRPRETVASLSPRTARRVTEKQLNRLYAISRGGRWTRDEVIGWMAAQFQKREPAELNWAEYDKLCNHILESPRSSEGRRE